MAKSDSLTRPYCKHWFSNTTLRENSRRHVFLNANPVARSIPVGRRTQSLKPLIQMAIRHKSADYNSLAKLRQPQQICEKTMPQRRKYTSWKVSALPAPSMARTTTGLDTGSAWAGTHINVYCATCWQRMRKRHFARDWDGKETSTCSVSLVSASIAKCACF